jgi:REP element-mobilizing transposase RayT
MARIPKIALPKKVLFITTSVEEGLMFPPNPLVNQILIGCLAKAQKHHPLQISDILVEATHLHLIAIVENPDDVKGFMERFKTESAHAINRLLGRSKRTVWCESYDSPTLLTPEDAINKIAYLYENPSKDGLEDRIELYPGISAFKLRGKDSGFFEAPLIARNDIQKLPDGELTESDYRTLAKQLSYGKQRIKFRLSPNAWLESFGINEPKEVEEINKRIINTIRAREDAHRAARKRENKSVIGYRQLIATPVGRKYIPSRSGKRTWCICHDKKTRMQFIERIKSLVREARRVLERWRIGDLAQRFPLGLYPPALPRIANLAFF